MYTNIGYTTYHITSQETDRIFICACVQTLADLSAPRMQFEIHYQKVKGRARTENLTQTVSEIEMFTPTSVVVSFYQKMKLKKGE